MNEDRDGVLVRCLQELILYIFLADLDIDPTELLDVFGLFGLVLFMAEVATVHYFDNSGVLLDVVGAKNRIFNPDAGWDETDFGVISRFGVDGGWALAVSIDDFLVESGVTCFSLLDSLAEGEH